MDYSQLPEDALIDCDFEELLNSSFSLDLENFAEEKSAQWLDGLVISAGVDNSESPSGNKGFFEDGTVDLCFETVEACSKQKRHCGNIGKNNILQRLVQSNHIENTTDGIAIQHNEPPLQSTPSLKTEDSSSILSQVNLNNTKMKTASLTRYNKTQLAVLKDEFKKCQYLDSHTCVNLVSTLNLTDLQVSKWFDDWRAKQKRPTEDSQSSSTPTEVVALPPLTGVPFKRKYRSKRSIFSVSQLAVLELEFKKCQRPDYDRLSELASMLNLTDNKVRIWFANRRAKQKKLKLYGQSSSMHTEFVTFQSSVGSFKRKYRAKRSIFSGYQLAILENEFKSCRRPSYDKICELASAFNLTDDRVRIWFKNRRFKQKKSEKPDQKVQPKIQFSIVSPSTGSFKRKKRARRTFFNRNQLIFLEHEFRKCHFPDYRARCKLASILHLTNDQVRTWFQNRRSRQKKLSDRGEQVQPQTESFNLSTSTESPKRNYRSKRTFFSRSQLAALEYKFKKNQFANYDTLCELASTLNLTYYQVRIWFANRRAKQKKCKHHEQLPPTQTKLVTVQPFLESSEQKYRAKRTIFSKNQLAELEHEFKKCKHPDFDQISILASTFNLTDDQVRIWFKNRRSKQKKSDDFNPLEQQLIEISSSSSMTGSYKQKCRAKRTVFSKSQLDVLVESFNKCQYPDYDTICELASELNLTDFQVRTWFKNQRSKKKVPESKDQSVQLQTGTSSLPSPNKLKNSEEPQCPSVSELPITWMDQQNQAEVALPSSVQQTTVLFEGLKNEKYNNRVLQLSGEKDSQVLPLIPGQDECCIDPAPPSAQYVCSYFGDAPVNNLPVETYSGMTAYKEELSDTILPTSVLRESQYLY